MSKVPFHIRRSFAAVGFRSLAALPEGLYLAAARGGQAHLAAILVLGLPLALLPAAVRAQAPPGNQDLSPGSNSGRGGGTPQRAPDTFSITAIDVSGVTKLSHIEIERLIYPFLGPGRSNQDVVAARKALQDAYSAKGYDAVLVEIPVQPAETFSSGVIQIVVNETPLGRVRVLNSQYHALSAARADVPSLVEGQPVDLKALQQDIAEANRFPDRTIEPSFAAGQVPGTIDVDLKVNDSRPWHASLDLNNDHSPSTRSLRLAANASYSNLWGLGHTISMTYSVAPENRSQSEVYSSSYNAPLIGTPWSFLLYGYTSNSNVAALGGTNVLGNGYQIGARVIYRLPSTKSFQQISFGPDFKAFNENIFVKGEPLRPTPIRYVPLVAEYTLSGAGTSTSYGITLGTTLGLRVVKRHTCVDLGSADIPDQAPTCALAGGGIGVPEDQFQGRSIDAHENFVHLNMDANITHSLPKDIVLAGRLAGQFADSSLVTNEQFSIGGVTSVRGFYLSEAVGDDGVIGSLELRSPDVSSRLWDSFDELRVFTFGDYGHARIRRPALGQRASFTLASLGGGLRVRLLNYLSGEFVIGVPVTNGPESKRGDPRYRFSLKGGF